MKSSILGARYLQREIECLILEEDRQESRAAEAIQPPVLDGLEESKAQQQKPECERNSSDGR